MLTGKPGNKPFDFGADPYHNPDPGNYPRKL